MKRLVASTNNTNVDTQSKRDRAMPKKPRDRWYSLDGQAKSRSIAYEKSTGTRRLVSLAMLLALVVILIQRASDVKQIEKVGRAVGLFPASANQGAETDAFASTSSHQNGIPDASSAGEQPQEEGNGTPRTEQVLEFESWRLKSADKALQSRVEMWIELLKPASDQTVELLAALHFRSTGDASNPDQESSSSERAIAPEGDWRDSTRETIQSWLRLTAGEQDSKSDAFRSAYRELAAILDRGAEGKTDSRDFQLALDHRLLGQFQDNSVWRPSEQIPLLRTANRASGLAERLTTEAWLWNDIPWIQSSQLMSSFSESIRGVPIKLRGTIGKIDDRDGKVESAGWDVFEYQVLWVKPDDATSQPIAVFQPKRPRLTDRKWEVGETVEVIGMYCKRFAYQSQRGSEVAPALIAAGIHLSNELLAAPHGAYAKWLRSLPSVRIWQPPKDVEAPYMAILGAVTASLRNASNSQNQTDGPISNQVASLLVESQRLHSLVDTLLASHSPWRVTEDVEIAERSGIVVSAEKIELASVPKTNVEAASGLAALLRSDLQAIYRLRVELFSAQPTTSSSEQAVVSKPNRIDVYCNQIPEAWSVAFEGKIAKLRQPVSVRGFLQKHKPEDVSSMECLVTDQVRWQLPESRPEDWDLENTAWQPPIPPPLKHLLERGWSLEQKQYVSSLQRPPRALTSAELPALYSLLRLQSLRNGESRFEDLNREELANLLKRSLRNQRELGESTCLQPIQTTGRIVRISRIDVDDESQREILGQDHYFQLDCMVDIGNTTFEILTNRAPIVYQHEYPATGLVLALPNWLWQAKSPDRAGSIGNELTDTAMSFPRFRFTSSGWLYRFWSYKTEEMSGSLGLQHRQVVPLLVLHELNTPSENTKPPSAPISANKIGWLIPLLAVAAIWYYVRRYSKPPSRPRRLRP